MFYIRQPLPLCPPWHAQYRAVFPALSSPLTPTLFSMHSLSQLKLPAHQEKKGQTSIKAKNQDICWPQTEETDNNGSVGRCRTSFGCFVHGIVDGLCLLGH